MDDSTTSGGFAFCTSPCIGCGRLFSYNPITVPSSSAITGAREPICETCLGVINGVRQGKGLAPIVPAADAYTCCEASALL